MSNPTHVIAGFVIDRLDAEPVAVRAQMYRALAAVAATNAEKAAYEKLAAGCDALTAAHAQLVFDFRQRNRA